MFSRRKRDETDIREWNDISVWLSDVVEAVELRPEPAPLDLILDTKLAAQG